MEITKGSPWQTGLTNAFILGCGGAPGLVIDKEGPVNRHPLVFLTTTE